jgi:hypothetical protein
LQTGQSRAKTPYFAEYFEDISGPADQAWAS